MNPWTEQEVGFPTAQGNDLTSEGINRLVKNHTEETRRSMTDMTQIIRCCWLDRFFLDVSTWDIIMDDPRADRDDVNFGRMARNKRATLCIL
mmetsp:Transcript_11153/g.16748  ORF Transcript_11153/g.16748 Transcript_11153/m.16748 type:complete len:92 (+) Transcript_11153:148-423(+)